MKILFLDILTDDKKIKEDLRREVYKGLTYGEYLRGELKLPRESFVEVDATVTCPANPEDFDGIIIGGSVEDPIEGKEKTWMHETYKFIREAADKNIPLLGFCGGYQFTIRALGGEIIMNPRGRNMGNSEVYLTKEGLTDSIFHGVPGKFTALASHKCIVRDLKPEWRLLAYSLKSPFDAVAIGENIRLFQFHPELSSSVICSIAALRKPFLIEEGFFESEKDYEMFRAKTLDTETVRKQILQNFLRNFVKE